MFSKWYSRRRNDSSARSASPSANELMSHHQFRVVFCSRRGVEVTAFGVGSPGSVRGMGFGGEFGALENTSNLAGLDTATVLPNCRTTYAPVSR